MSNSTEDKGTAAPQASEERTAEASTPEPGRKDEAAGGRSAASAADATTPVDTGRQEASGAAPAASGGGGGAGRATAALMLAVITLIVVLAVAVLGWWRLQALEERRADFVSEAELARSSQQSGERIASLEATVEGLSAEVSGRSDMLAEVRSALSDAEAAREAIDQRLDRIGELAESTLDDWRRSEAAYLVTVAEYRLRYYRDVDASLDALRSADELLSEYGGESVEARRAVARAIDALIEVSVPPASEIVASIDQLTAAVDDLPLRIEPERLAPSESEADPDALISQRWRDMLGDAWAQVREGLSGLVVVSSERRAVPLRTPEERFFIAQSLRLQLDTARIAALRGDQDMYERSLATAADWLDNWFDGERSAVAEVRRGVESLRGRTVAVNLPDIGPMLAPARSFD